MVSAEAMRAALRRAGFAALALSRGQGQCGVALTTGRRTHPPCRRESGSTRLLASGIGEQAMKKAIYVALGLAGLVAVGSIATLAQQPPQQAAVGGQTAGSVTQPAPGVTRTELYNAWMTGTEERDVTLYTYEVAAGSAVPRHIHPGDEMGYVLDGDLSLEVDGDAPMALHKGEVFHMPALKPHSVRNVGSTPAKLFLTSVTVRGKQTTIWLH
jgi:quercetin dioxygenase-like cupin family protein